MRATIPSIMIALLLIAGANAATQTVDFKGFADCELIPEKEVLVLTQVYADYDGQKDFGFDFDLPGKAPYAQNEHIEYGQHKIFVYVPDADATAEVNYEFTSGNDVLDPTSIWTSAVGEGMTRRELIKTGKNHVVVYTHSNVTVKAGDLVVEVAATSCSDAVWKQAEPSPFPPKDNVCPNGAEPTATDDKEHGYTTYSCPEPDEVPEFGVFLLPVIGLIGVGMIAVKKPKGVK